MKALILFLLVIRGIDGVAQSAVARKSMLVYLQIHDSLVFYQCRVVDPNLQPQLASDIVHHQEPYTVTDKLVLIKDTNELYIRAYTATLKDFPNRKFSGLKIRERPYWNFKLVAVKTLSSQEMAQLAAIETSGREAIEYDYPVTKYTRNQVIIKKRKHFKQLVIENEDGIMALLGLR